MTHYEILEVSEQASLDVINAAWKTLQLRYHPDGSQPDGEKSRLINQAHDILENSEQRRRYDLSIAQDRAAQRQMEQSPPAWIRDSLEAYPNAYPPNILEQAAMRIGSNMLEGFMAQNPELAFIIRTATARRPRGKQ